MRLARALLAVFLLTGVVTLVSPADPAAAAPSPPASCSARDKGTKWGLSWDLVAGNIDGYIIERTLDGGASWDFRGRDNVPGSDLQFEDSDNNANALYRVSSQVDPADRSAAVVCSVAGGGGGGGDSVRPTTPRKPVVVGQGVGSVTLSLEHRGDNVGVTTFRLFRNTVNVFATATELTIPVASNPQQHTDSNLAAGNYWYWLKVSDAAGNVSYRSGERPVTITGGGGGGGEPIPAGRRTNWESTGVDGGVASYPAKPESFDVTQYGADPSNPSDDLAGIQAAMAAARQNGGGTVYFPNGTYRLSAALVIGRDNNGVVLEGESRSAILEFTNRFNGSAINFQGRSNLLLSNGTTTPTGSAGLRVVQGSIGTRTMTVNAGNLDPVVLASDLVGRHAWIDHEAGANKEGQIVEIVGATRNGSVLTVSLRDDLEHALDGSNLFLPFQALDGVGIRNLGIRLPAAGLQVNQNAPSPLLSDVIALSFTANAFVSNVVVGESNVGRSPAVRRGQSRSHVLPNVSYRCEVRDSDFVDAALHGDGGQGYGINFSNNASRCLIENNTFEGLRHSILFHEGATANVAAFNYARNPFHPNHVKGGPADLSFHGFSVANLVEGNVMERIHMSDAAATGQHNTVLRNCLYTGPLTVQRAIRGNFVGNAMFGTSSGLRNRQMPAAVGPIGGSNAVVVTPAHPYLNDGTEIFDSRGFQILTDTPVNVGNLFSNNWYNGSRSDTGASIPTSYYNSSYAPILSNPTSAIASCTNAATTRAGDFADAFNG